MHMSKWNITSFSKEEQDKVSVEDAASLPLRQDGNPQPEGPGRDSAAGSEMRENTEWHRVVLFGKLAEVASEYLRKGAQVYVFCGDLLNAPAGCYLHPFESRSPQGRKRARAMADVQGAVYRVPFTLDS